MRGATVTELADIMKRAVRDRRLGITAKLEDAPIVRVREHRPVHALRLELMRDWYTPGHVEEFLNDTGVLAQTTAALDIEPGNKLRVMIMWGSGAPPWEADTCILSQVRVRWADLAAELEGAGFADEIEDDGGIHHTPEPLPAPDGQINSASASVRTMRKAYKRLIQEGEITADLTTVSRYRKVRASPEVTTHIDQTGSTRGYGEDNFANRVVNENWPGKPAIASLKAE